MAISSPMLFNQQQTPFDDLNRKKLLRRIDLIPGFKNVRVVYFNGTSFTVLRPHPPMCMARKLTLVIRPNNQQLEQITHPQANKQNDSRFYDELLSTGLSCSAAIMSWIVVGGSSAAIPVSGGTSTVITVLAYGAATASSLQCINSSYRLYNETDYGNSEVNIWLDSNDWYQHTSTALDVVSVVGGVTSASATLKTVLNLKKAGTPIKKALQGLSRQERKRLTEELIRHSNPKISNKALKALVAAGKYPKRYSSFEISQAIRLQLKDAISATLSFTGSATSGVVRDPTRIKKFVVGVIEEFESY